MPTSRWVEPSFVVVSSALVRQKDDQTSEGRDPGKEVGTTQWISLDSQLQLHELDERNGRDLLALKQLISNPLFEDRKKPPHPPQIFPKLKNQTRDSE
jgi:hypothetical protein